MRKLLSMAVVVMMIALATTGCKNEEKNTDPTTPGKTEITDNPLYNAFKLCKDFVGKEESDVKGTLTTNGFEYASTGGVYMKVCGSYWMQTSYKLAGTKIYDFSINVTPYKAEGATSYTAVLTGDYVVDAVNKIGEKFTMSSINVRFWRTYDNLMQTRAETFSDFKYVVEDNRLHDTQTIWLDENINHYDAEDESSFKGMKMKANRDNNNYGGVQEYSITFMYIDNTLNK